MDGVELAGKLKLKRLAHIPVILLTAIGSEEKQLEGLKARCERLYPAKPFTFFEIPISRIRNLPVAAGIIAKRFQNKLRSTSGGNYKKLG